MSGKTVIHSNALSFFSYIQHGVDPRTGQYTVSLSLPELKNNALAGPVLPLTLSFSPLNTTDAGYGRGWGLNLTEYNPQSRRLSLGTGETYTVDGDGNQPLIKEKKLDSFHFHDDGGGMYRVVHRSGQVEILKKGGSGVDPLALPEQVLGPDGRAVTLTYVPFAGDRRLETVSDDSGELLRVVRNAGSQQVELQFFPDKGEGSKPLATFILKLDGNERVSRVILPTEEQACWKLEYTDVRGIFCLSEVWTPAGGHETVKYNDVGHVFPGPQRPALPRVTEHVIDPRNDQPTMKVEYTYSSENFLGNGALTSWDDNGYDNLYNVTDHTFSYWSKASHFLDGVAVRDVQRYYNRFHLMTEEVTTQGNCRKRVVTTYYADDPQYINLPFERQPAQCQLPMQIDTHWELVGDSTRKRTETSQTRFDDWGNLTLQVNADGTQEVIEYYPAAGGENCPADPEGFVRHVHTRTVHPAPSEHGAAPILKTEHAYTDIAPLPSLHSKRFVVETWQQLSEVGGGELQRTDTEYFDNPADTLRLGREKSVTETMNGKSTDVDYAYALLDSTRVAQSVLQVKETVSGFDGTHRTITQEHSLLNGEPLLVEDDNGVEIRYQYDALARVVVETVAPDHAEYEASRTYKYHLVGEDSGDQAWQLLTDVKGVSTRTLLDGQARPVREERQDVDAADEEGRRREDAVYRDTYRARYNGLGELVEETDIDWLQKESRELTSAYGYDDWGERVSTTRPDKVMEWDVLDPIGNREAPGAIRTSWLRDTGGVDGGKVVTWLDDFKEPARIERFDTAATPNSISVEQQHRDGLGRLVVHINAVDQTTRYTYDAFDRTVTTTLPGGAKVTRSYAPHSAEDLPISIDVDGRELGTQTFDGLDRRVEATTGGRKRVFQYEGGKARPTYVVTPAQTSIEYHYYEQLGEEIEKRIVPGTEASYSYDAQNSRLTGCAEQGISLTRSYYSNGEVKQETRTYDDGSAETVVDYVYSLRGRLLGSTLLGRTQTNTYDAMGRLKLSVLGDSRSEFNYDSFGRIKDIISVDVPSSSSLSMGLEYDDFGRETLRAFNANGSNRELKQTYYPDDALHTRVLSEHEVVVRGETFHYDTRGRLLRHECEGTELPQDAYGNTFTRQVFISDALDNLTRVTTTLGPTEFDVAEFKYESPLDPVQLTYVTHSHADYPSRIDLTYDADGNLTTDEQGRTLVYDPLGRLTDVGALGTLAAANYRFDALDILAERSSDGHTERRYYVDGDLTARVEDGEGSHYLRAGGHVLAEQRSGTDTRTVLLGTDRSNTVLQEVRPGAQQHIAYTAYGFPGRDSFRTEVAYNGELHESGTGWQLLGNGYRAYNPLLQRFHSPDELSPFHAGGLNAYGYCGNDPANFADPSGHSPMAWGAVLLGLGTTVAVGGLIFVDDPGLKLGLAVAGGLIAVAGVGALGVGVFGKKPGGSGGAPNRKSEDPQWVLRAREQEAMDAQFGFLGNFPGFSSTRSTSSSLTSTTSRSSIPASGSGGSVRSVDSVSRRPAQAVNRQVSAPAGMVADKPAMRPRLSLPDESPPMTLTQQNVIRGKGRKENVYEQIAPNPRENRGFSDGGDLW